MQKTILNIHPEVHVPKDCRHKPLRLARGSEVARMGIRQNKIEVIGIVF